MKILGITQTVASLEKSKQFYEDILGFKEEAFYQPTRWLSFQCQEGVFYAVGEAAAGSTDEIAFAVSEIEAFWEKVKDRVDVVNPLEKTPWGTYRFVIRDPDGHLLAFGEPT
jgi:catechol 2,3-dioxygenase-like lactoylglutathione lyase family enzyme